MKNLVCVCTVIFMAVSGFAQTLQKQRLDSLFQILESRDKFMGSIAISQNGKIQYARAIGFADIERSKKATAQTKFRIGSVSKIFTAALVLKAIDEKKITINETLDKYFPKVENAPKITIENMLNHRSGIHNFTDDADYKIYNTGPKTQKQMLEIIEKGKSDFIPNSKTSYSNTNYVLLSLVLEKIYKKDYASILSEKIIKPLKLRDTYFGNKTNIENNESYSYKFDKQWIREPETNMSIPLGAGGIVSNPIDLTIFIDQLFDGKIISERALVLMKTMKDETGLGMFEFPFHEKVGYGHSGGIDAFQSILTYFPDEKLAVAVTSNGTQYSLGQILKGALSSFYDEPFRIPTFDEIIISEELLDTYVGEYASTQIPPKFSVTKKGKQLSAKATGQPAFPLEAVNTNTFKFEQAGIIIEFNAAKKELMLKQGDAEFLFSRQ